MLQYASQLVDRTAVYSPQHKKLNTGAGSTDMATINWRSLNAKSGVPHWCANVAYR
jgi:hypothetical protein